MTEKITQHMPNITSSETAINSTINSSSTAVSISNPTEISPLNENSRNVSGHHSIEDTIGGTTGQGNMILDTIGRDKTEMKTHSTNTEKRQV